MFCTSLHFHVLWFFLLEENYLSIGKNFIMPAENMLPVEVTRLFLSNVGFVVLLEGDLDERALPIFIGAAEAQSIAKFINDVDVPRPLTHDLLKNILEIAEYRLMRVEVADIKDGTFYAQLIMDHDDSVIEMDCRPSDAIAIALRCDAPIYVAEHVLENAGLIFDEDALGDLPRLESGHKHKGAVHQKPIHKKSPLDTLKARQARAVADERYEDAARLRDEIARLNHTHTEN
jgi:bifunctional DNase/RNase